MEPLLCLMTHLTLIYWLFSFASNLLLLLSLYAFSSDSYSAAGSEGSISTSVASLPPQASGSSAPSSPGSRRSVSTLKKWLTNPVRKLSAGSTAKGERQVRKLEGKPASLPSHSQNQDMGSLPRPVESLTILPVTHREPVRIFLIIRTNQTKLCLVSFAVPFCTFHMNRHISKLKLLLHLVNSRYLYKLVVMHAKLHSWANTN